MLEVVNLQCTRGDRRLFSGIAFELAPGELLHLHGHNGSGKTTLMRALCGLVTPTEGEVRWKGEPIRRQRDEFHAELLYLGHKNGIKDDLTGVENLRTACRLAGIAVSEKEAWEVL
ncbi:MAG TPA: ATP-binding cassette domain-containing protein, partial [Thiolapillus brandeum]|nr:ATP-binding cassette domain-containing protein [Thiolapillus brandeum]